MISQTWIMDSLKNSKEIFLKKEIKEAKIILIEDKNLCKSLNGKIKQYHFCKVTFLIKGLAIKSDLLLMDLISHTDREHIPQGLQIFLSALKNLPQKITYERGIKK